MDRVATFVRGIVLVIVVVVDEAVASECKGVMKSPRTSRVKVADLPEPTAVSQSNGWMTADGSRQAAVGWLDPGQQDRHREGQSDFLLA